MNNSTAYRRLVVDDETSVVIAFRKYFSRQGFHVDIAGEREEAEALIVTSHYDVVIADLRLSWSHGSEGLELLRFVRAQSRGTQVVILTAYGSPDVERAAQELGGSVFMQKPKPLAEVADAVAALLKDHARDV